MSITTIDSISKTRVKLLLSEPFYGHFMLGLPKEVSVETQTAAVALMNKQNIKLIINEDFWNTLSESCRYGIIKHEILHIVLKHLFTLKNYTNKILYNIAADIVVNQYIERTQLPDGCILIEQFAYLKTMFSITLEPNKDVGYYYNQLNKTLKNPPKTSFEKAVKETNLNDSKGEPQIEISNLLKNLSKTLESHKHWSKIDKLNEAERKLAECQVNNTIKQTADRVKHKYKNYGNLPAGLAEILADILADMKPQFNWRRLLRLFATNSNSTYIKNTIRRPSKRLALYLELKSKGRINYYLP